MRREDRGAGVLGAAAGLLVTVLFLALAVQILLSLYATTTVRVTLHDAASRAADQGVVGDRAAVDRIAAQAERSLGPMGERTSILLEPRDLDGRGLPDVVVGEAVSVPPRVVPASLGGLSGFGEVRVGVRVRVERPR